MAEYSLDDLHAAGWLFRPSTGASLADALASRDASRVSWAKAVPDGVEFLSYSTVCLVALVLKTIALESTAGSRVDVNHELVVAGVANCLAGGCGGVVANHSASHVGVLRGVRVSNRRAALCVLVLTTCLLVSGWPLMNVLPCFLLGGLLISLGAQLCADWLWAARLRMERGGQLVLLAMVATAVVTTTPSAVFVGLIAAMVIGLLRTSSLPALRYHLTGRAYHPSISRPVHVQAFLKKHGGAIHLLGLEGALREGTIARLLRYLLGKSSALPALTFVILDLELVQYIDPAACPVLCRLLRAMCDRDVRLVFAHLQPSLVAPLVAHAVLRDDWPAGTGRLHATVDAALEWCEDELLLRGSPRGGDGSSPPGDDGDDDDVAPGGGGLSFDRYLPFLRAKLAGLRRCEVAHQPPCSRSRSAALPSSGLPVCGR